MLYDTKLASLYIATSKLTEPLLRKVYYFHDVRVTCQTNSPALLPLLETMFDIFPEPGKVQGEVTYSVLCYDNAAEFPVQLPQDCIRTETISLLPGTKLKYYRSKDHTSAYQSYEALPPINEVALTIISQNAALTQLEKPQNYQEAFLQRYVLLLALGQLLHQFGFEACHAAAITSPRDDRQGALILGASGSGKTSLSLGCASTGCGMLGDDIVLLRSNFPDKMISAYAITHEVSVRSGSLDLWQTLSFLRDFPADHRDKRYCTIERVRAGAARIQAPIRLLIFPSLTTQQESTVTALSQASTLQELLELCVSKNNTDAKAQEKLFFFLSSLAEQAPGYRLSIAYGASDGPDMVHSLFTGLAL